MRQIDIAYQTMLAELGQRCLDAQFVRDFRFEHTDARYPAEGSFFKTTIKEKVFWYHQTAMVEGRRKKSYVGPVLDPEITRRVEAFAALLDDVRARRKLVATLIRDAGLPQAEQTTGQVVEALAAAGLFRLRAVLVGTVAFQCYPGLLGRRLPSTALQTGDADIAQFFAVSAEVEDTTPPIERVLKEVDPSFRAIPSQGDPRRATAFENSRRYRVEFLTPNRGSDDYAGQPAPMPALGGASAQPLRFLDFLIHQPVRAVMLHGAGVSVLVPAPERYAVHKLIVATRRRADGESGLKRHKDIRQAQLLFEALFAARRHGDAALAYMEAWERGESWQEAITFGLSTMSEERAAFTREGLAAGILALREKPEKYGL